MKKTDLSKMSKENYATLAAAILANAKGIKQLRERLDEGEYPTPANTERIDDLVEFLGLEEEALRNPMRFNADDEMVLSFCEACYREKTTTCWFGGCPEYGETEEEFNNR